MLTVHRQLRPKVNNYNLTIEKGDGFELNRSLFERLVLESQGLSSLNSDSPTSYASGGFSVHQHAHVYPTKAMEPRRRNRTRTK
jgi:hypothetical protein